MKNFLAWLLKAYAAGAAYAVALLLLIVLVLVAQGALTADRIRGAVRALRAAPPPTEPAVPTAGKTSGGLAEREQILEKRTQELRILDERTTTRLSLIRAEQEALDRKREESIAAAEEAKKAKEEFAAAKSDAELAANVPILSRMEAPGIVSVLRTGDDARFVRYLRALRPGKAAEVIETLRSDPQFDEEFRRVPPDAPPGTKSRFERLNEEFQKVP